MEGAVVVVVQGGANSRIQRRPSPGATFRYDCVFAQKRQGMGKRRLMLRGTEGVGSGWDELRETWSGEVEVRIRGPMPMCPQLCWNV